ncbi:MAG: amino acid ABC transporter substrate-binding protein, partial [Deltaproteobacteria bacterium]|nr:amino acid ABC transporter substrate-binding protein [Deltaproteobacteria bacterium]
MNISQKKTGPAFLILVFLLVCLAGCEKAQTPALKNRGYIYLGLVAPQSGPLKPYGENLIRGAQMAIDAVNAAGGIKGRPVKLRLEDEAQIADMPGSRRLARDPRVHVVIGHLLEHAFAASRPMYLKANLPVLLPVLSGDDISLSDKGLFFRLMTSDSAQAEALAEYAIGTLKMRRLLVIHEDSDYGRSLAQSFARALKQKKTASIKAIVFSNPEASREKLMIQATVSRPEAV